MGINSFIVAVSSAAGPTIAAAILSVASWQWLFAINVPLGIVAIFFALRYLPENGPKNTMPRFDLPSAVMNALTFGLLITALSGFAQGQSLSLIAAEIVAMLIIGFFLRTTSAGAARAVTAGGFAAYSAVFAIHLYLHLLVLRPDAGAGCAAVLFAERDWPFGSGNRLAAHAPGLWQPW